MFQKLYKHLEEINDNTRQHQDHLSDAERWAEKISGQLETLNASLRTNADSAAEIQQDLLQHRRTARSLQTASLVLASLGILMVVILSFYTWNQSRTIQQALEQSAEAARISGSLRNDNQQAAYRQQDLRGQVDRLDSIVQQQHQTIQQLKKLNETAVHTFTEIKKDLARHRQEDLSVAPHTADR